MRNVLTITLNELRVNFANTTSLIFLIALPIVFTVILGVGLGAAAETVIPLDVVDLDGSDLSRRLVDTLRDVGGETLTLCVLTDSSEEQPEACALPAETDLEPEALTTKRIEDNDTYAAVVIPEGFGDRLLAGEDVNVAYRANAGYDAPTFIRQSVDAAISRASGSVVTARLSVEAAQAANAITEEDAETFFNDVYQAAEQAWETPPTRLHVEATLQEDSQASTAAGFSQSAPGMACMFVMMNVLAVTDSIVRSRQNGTFQRLIVMPVPRWGIMAGKLLAYFLVGFAQFLLIVSIGGLLGVNYGDDIIAIFVLAAVYTLTITAMGLALATLMRTLGQANAIRTLLGIVLAPLGGAWWPMDVVPQFMNTAGHIVSPIAWAMDAFSDMIYYGKGLTDILPYLGVLLLYAASFFVIGVWRFKYE
jgi:ABC-2 type transport system permease protein